MTSRDNHMTNRSHPSSLDELGAAVRAVADGEATPEQRKALEAARARLSPRDAAALDATVAAERSLRDATGRCMRDACPPCPADLRGRIAAAASAERGAAPSSAPAPVDRDDNRGPFVLAMFRRNWAFAAAALIALVAIASLFALPILAPRYNTWPPDAAARQSLVSFLGQEHGNCAPMGRYADLKLQVREPVAAAEFISRWTPDARAVMNAGGDEYAFLGVGRCAVPGAGASMHMVLAPAAPGHGAISVFLQDASSRTPDAMPRTIAQLGETADGQVIRAFAHGECLVYVVAPTDEDAERIAKNLGE